MIKAMLSEGEKNLMFSADASNYIMIFYGEQCLIVDHVSIFCTILKIMIYSLGGKHHLCTSMFVFYTRGQR